MGYIGIVPDTTEQTLITELEKKIKPHSIVYTDCYRSYNVLDMSGFL